MGSVILILLDTCTLLWWTLEPEELSPKARKVCNSIPQDGAFISSISVWEIGVKMHKGMLEIGETFEGYINRVKLLGSIEIIPIDEKIWIRNIQLDWQHRDPADRTIVATAMLWNLPIVTKDKIILDYYSNTIW